MTIDGKIRDEKLQYCINRKAAKISALSSIKIAKYEYLTGEEILPSDQRGMIKQAKFTYFPLRKALKNKQKQLQTKILVPTYEVTYSHVYFYEKKYKPTYWWERFE